jgi:hypothetical protein
MLLNFIFSEKVNVAIRILLTLEIAESGIYCGFGVCLLTKHSSTQNVECYIASVGRKSRKTGVIVLVK